MRNRVLKIAAFIFIIILFQPEDLFAYVGPGTGMTAIGTFIAFVFGILIAILGFVWYPVKRLLKKKSKEPDQVNNTEE